METDEGTTKQAEAWAEKAMTSEGFYEKGDIIEVPAWWDEDRPTICDVLKDQCEMVPYLEFANGKPQHLLKSRFVEVRKHGCAGAHARDVKAEKVIRFIGRTE